MSCHFFAHQTEQSGTVLNLRLISMDVGKSENLEVSGGQKSVATYVPPPHFQSWLLCRELVCLFKKEKIRKFIYKIEEIYKER